MSEPRSATRQNRESAARTAHRDPLELAVAIGTLLVIYGYLGGLWLAQQGSTPEPVALLRTWVNIPFGIGDDFGALGIALLLIASSYQAGAATRRHLGTVEGQTRWSWLGAAIALLALLIATLTEPHWPGTSSTIAHLLCAAALVLFGNILHGHASGRIGQWPAALLAVGCFTIVIVADGSYAEISDNWYPLTTLYALLIFMLALSRGHRVAALKVVRWLGSRGYALAIGTGVVGYPLLRLLAPAVATPIVYLLALSAIGICAEASVRACRWLTRSQHKRVAYDD